MRGRKYDVSDFIGTCVCGFFSSRAPLCCAPAANTLCANCALFLGIHTPRKVGPMLKMADIVVVTKGDVVSQAEREVFAFHVRKANTGAIILQVNGITGQGCAELAHLLREKAMQEEDTLHLRFPMPAALCSYCLGETRIGKEYLLGNVRKMQFDE